MPKMATFLSTPSARRATGSRRRGRVSRLISIHALREEGDLRSFIEGKRGNDFYPRPPRGGRHRCHIRRAAGVQFLSTPSARRATADPPHGAPALRNFYPRPPRGGRPTRPRRRDLTCTFLSTPSARRATRQRRPAHQSCGDFYPRPPRGGRPGMTEKQRAEFIFLSTPSARRATAKTERKYSAFVSLYTSLHKLQRGVCKASRKITPLLAQSAVIPVRSIPENHVHCLFALAGHQKISTLSCANSGCSPTCSTLVW